MLIVIVVIASSIISSAQPSTQCIAAYNATFDSSDKTCLAAYVRLLQGAYISQDRMMVCDAGQQCNTMIENVIDICGDTVSYVANMHGYSLGKKETCNFNFVYVRS